MFSIEFSSSVVSFVLMFIAFLISAGLGGASSAYIKYFIGDRLAVYKGYGSINPLIHIDLIGIIVFIFLRFFWRVEQPFSWIWSSGFKGLCERILYILGNVFFHLIFASILLSIGVAIWKPSFIALTLSVASASSTGILNIGKAIFPHLQSIQVICALFIASLIVANIIFAIIELVQRFSEYTLRTYIFPYQRGIGVQLLSVLIIVGLFIFFENVIWTTAWQIVSFPIIKLSKII